MKFGTTIHFSNVYNISSPQVHQNKISTSLVLVPHSTWISTSYKSCPNGSLPINSPTPNSTQRSLGPSSRLSNHRSELYSKLSTSFRPSKATFKIGRFGWKLTLSSPFRVLPVNIFRRFLAWWNLIHTSRRYNHQLVSRCHHKNFCLSVWTSPA